MVESGTPRAVLNVRDQAFVKRMELCDGCHDPQNPPVFAMFVEIKRLGSGSTGKSVFTICRVCASRPVEVYLHGSGNCSPAIKVHGSQVVEETVEPPVEIIDHRKQAPYEANPETEAPATSTNVRSTEGGGAKRRRRNRS